MSRRSRVMILVVLVLGSAIAAFVAIRLTLASNDLAQAEQAVLDGAVTGCQRHPQRLIERVEAGRLVGFDRVGAKRELTARLQSCI